jgi:Fic family protein
MKYTYDYPKNLTSYEPEEQPGWRGAQSPSTSCMLQHLSENIPLAVTAETLQELRILYVLHSDVGEDVGVRDAGRTRQIVEDPSVASTRAEKETANTYRALRKVEECVVAARNQAEPPLLTVPVLLEWNRIALAKLHPRNGQFRTSDAFTVRQTCRYYYIDPFTCELELQGLVDDVNAQINTTPDLKGMFQIAAHFCARFLIIHPFPDGNGRVARLGINYLLWNLLGFPFRIPSEYISRDTYLGTITACQPEPCGTLCHPCTLLALLIESANYSM